MFLGIVTDTTKDFVQRMQHCYMFTIGFVLESPNLRKTFTSYDKRPRNSKLYKNRSLSTVIIIFQGPLNHFFSSTTS